MPKPPCRKVLRQRPSPHYDEVETEVHRALASLGRDNQTYRLSDSEFGSQVVDELEYMARKSGAHLGRGICALMQLLGRLF
jgi:hypothetical protein